MLHYDPQHVLSNTLLILRRTNCITTASGIVTLCKQPYSMQVESGLRSPPAYCILPIAIRHVHPIYNSSGDKMTHSQTDIIRNNETYLFPSRPLSRYCYHIFHSRFLKDKKQGSETILRFTAGPTSLQQKTLFYALRLTHISISYSCQHYYYY